MSSDTHSQLANSVWSIGNLLPGPYKRNDVVSSTNRGCRSLVAQDKKVSTDFFYDRETSKIDRMVAKVEDAIERLQEYRTALITVGVTGKIELCGYGHTTEAA